MSGGCQEYAKGEYIGHLCRIHFVHSDDELTHTESKCQQRMLSCLPVFRYTGFKFSRATSYDKNSAIRLRRACNHVLDEVAMTGRINYLLVVITLHRISFNMYFNLR